MADERKPLSADEPKPKWSAADDKVLSRLVGRYGRGAVIARVKTVRPRRRGPPPDPAKWKMLTTIEEYEEDFRAAGRPAPFQAAVRKLFEETYPKKRRDNVDLFQKFLKRVRNARDEWRRVARAIKAARAKRGSARAMRVNAAQGKKD
jgi:hypothetical protein